MRKFNINLIAFIVCLTCGFNANAIAYLVDGIVYTTTGTTGTNELMVAPGGDNATYTGAITIPEGMNIDGVDYKVVGIANYAFRNTTITSINLPEGILTIGDQAFANCTSLTSVTLPSTITSIGAYGFLNCQFSAISLPESLVSIGKYTFSKCVNLTDITFPDNVTTIGERTFEGCPALKSITIGKNIKALPEYFAAGNATLAQVTFNGAITIIGNAAFSSCKALTSISLPEGLTTIGGSAFSASGISSVTLPASLVTLGNFAFSGTNLSTVTFLSDNTQVGDGAFQETPLVSVTLPQNLRSLPNKIFYKCTSLENITLPSNIVSIGDYALSKTKIKEITLPQNLTTIGNKAFNKCDSLTTVNNASTRLRSVGGDAFSLCRKLTSIDLPNAVIIGMAAFNICSSLKSVNIPAVESLGASAFNSCVNLTQITLPATIKRIYNNTFSNCISLRTVSGCENVDSIFAEAFDYCYNLRTLPPMNNLKYIGNLAFRDCMQLNWLPDGVTYVDNKAFQYCHSLRLQLPSTLEHIGENAFESTQMPSHLIIPDATTYLGNYAFSHCGEVDSIHFGSGLTVIPQYAFQKLTSYSSLDFATDTLVHFKGSLKSVKIPDNITEIEEYAFYEDKFVDTILIGDGVVRIGKCAFGKCPANYLSIGKSVTAIDSVGFEFGASYQVICKAATPPIYGDVWETTIYSKLIVPIGSKELYQAAPLWEKFTNITEQNFNAGNNMAGIEDIEINVSKAQIQVNGNSIVVNGVTPSDIVSIYDISGQPVSRSASFLTPGIYFVNVNDKTTKIIIK